MATSHFTLEVPQARLWELAMDPQYHQQYHQEGSDLREHMFEKPLTPSDVGKLNRLVIPKQHAEKYFPLAGDSGEKGLQLSFEDEAGKAWRFRYSYWTSSQSYVLTKGWSRFVKEKRLDAGDIVLFERTLGGDRHYIGCRRRGMQDEAPTQRRVANAAYPWNPVYYTAANSYPANPSDSSYLYMSSMQQERLLPGAGELAGGAMVSPVAPVNSKRLRLFGVNLDCGPVLPEPEPEPVHQSWLLSQSSSHESSHQF